MSESQQDGVAAPKVAPVDERLPFYRLFPLGLQHVLVMYASTLAVPFILAAALNLPKEDIVHLVAADLMLCGLGTILQSLRILKMGAGMPLVVGASFNLIAPMIVIGNDYSMPVLYGSIFASGLIVFLIAPYFTKLLRFFPPLVIGVSIALIGINLMPAGLSLIFGRNPAADDYADPVNMLIALFCIIAVVILYRVLPKIWSQLSILIAMLLGIVFAAMLGRLDLSGVASGPALQAPELFFWGLPEFKILPIVSLVIVWLVMMLETVGQVAAVGKIVDKPVTPSLIYRALRVDGFISMLGGVFQSFGYITFTQNVGVVSLTGVRSRFVTVMAGVILVVLSAFPIIGRFVAVIPNAVLGGVTLIMFATVTVIGIEIMARVDYQRMGNIVTAALALALGTIPVIAPNAYNNFEPGIRLFLHSGVAVGSLVAIFLNLVFNVWTRDPEDHSGDTLIQPED